LELSRWAREEINKIPGLYAFGRELVGSPGCFDFDETKLGINVRNLGYTGYQMESKLRKEYNIQVELSDLYNILALVAIGDRREDLESLVTAFKDLASKSEMKELKNITRIPVNPRMIVPPREAFYSEKRTVPLEESVGKISGEMVMAYPPGIPVICMGEEITKDIIDYIKVLKNERCELQGTADPYINYIKILA
jgi:arginine decarboxylase